MTPRPEPDWSSAGACLRVGVRRRPGHAPWQPDRLAAGRLDTRALASDLAWRQQLLAGVYAGCADWQRQPDFEPGAFFTVGRDHVAGLGGSAPFATAVVEPPARLRCQMPDTHLRGAEPALYADERLQTHEYQAAVAPGTSLDAGGQPGVRHSTLRFAPVLRVRAGRGGPCPPTSGRWGGTRP